MRKLSIENKRFVLNGRKIFFRGTLECCIFPLTGYPPTDVDAWLRIMRICRSYGLNHIRFHSWCPPEAAFEAADQMGFILQAGGAHVDLRLGQGRQTRSSTSRWNSANARCLWQPSVVRTVDDGQRTVAAIVAVIHRLVRIAKEYDRRHLYAAASGWGGGPDDDYRVTPLARGVRGPATTHDLRRRLRLLEQARHQP